MLHIPVIALKQLRCRVWFFKSIFLLFKMSVGMLSCLLPWTLIVLPLNMWLFYFHFLASCRTRRIWCGLQGEEMDQNSHEDGLCSWQGRGLAHPRALRANSLPLQPVPVRGESPGKLCWNQLLSSCGSHSGRVLLVSGMFVKLHFVPGVMQVTRCCAQHFRKPRANFSLEVKF